MDIATLNDALGRLRAKYGLPQGAIVPGTFTTASPTGL